MSKTNKTKNNNKHRKPFIKTKIDQMYDNPDSALRAYASINVAGAVSIHGLRVMDSEKGLFVAMPSRSYEDKNGNTKYAEIAHPITSESREAINSSVLKAYEDALDQTQKENKRFEQDSESENMLDEDMDEDGLAFEQSM